MSENNTNMETKSTTSADNGADGKNEPFLSFMSADVAANNGDSGLVANIVDNKLKADNTPDDDASPPLPMPLPLYRSTSTYKPTPQSSPPRSPNHTRRNSSFGNEVEAAMYTNAGEGRVVNGRPPLDRQAISMRLRQAAAAAAAPTSQQTQRITLDELLGQGKYETEAETNILAAFELQQQQQQQQHRTQKSGFGPSTHNRDMSSTSSILSNVPEQLAMDLVQANSVHDSGILNGTSRGVDNDSNRQKKIKTSRREANLLMQRHRRMMSTEDQLAGLHFAMSALDDHHGVAEGGNNDRLHGHSSSDYRNDDTASVSSDSENFLQDNGAGLSLGANPSAGDLLGHHAGLLLMEGGVDGTSNGNLTGSGLRQRKNTEVSLPPVLEEIGANAVPSGEASSTPASGADVEEGFAHSISDPDTSTSDRKENRKNDGREKGKQTRRSTVFRHAADKVKEDLDSWHTFFQPHKDQVWRYMRRILFYIIAPLVLVAAILFYFAGNPPTGTATGEERGTPGTTPSSSWWLLFTVRQVITFSMSLATQAFIIDFSCVGTRAMVRLVGPMVTLFIVQSKGWPFVVLAWGLFDFALLYGDNNFARHWLYYQDFVGLFNSENPSGHVVDSDSYRKILVISVAVALTTAAKRFVVGLYLGRQTFHHYGGQLAKVMNKMVLIAEVATLAKRIRKESLGRYVFHVRS
jgi:hypothetical protein